jgi:hypothetical protein
MSQTKLSSDEKNKIKPSRNEYFFLRRLAKRGLSAKEIIELGNPRTNDDICLLELSLREKFKYTFTEITDICLATSGWTLGKQKKLLNEMLFWATWLGASYTYQEIMSVGNPTDSHGATLAHWQAFQGHRFTIPELLTFPEKISYPPDEIFWTHEIQGSVGFYCILTPAEAYDMKEAVAHQGATVAHIMAREGYDFSDEEIEQLHNPVDADGKTIKDW